MQLYLNFTCNFFLLIVLFALVCIYLCITLTAQMSRKRYNRLAFWPPTKQREINLLRFKHYTSTLTTLKWKNALR